MKPISPSLQTHISSETTTLATCWKLTRRDSTTLGFTSHNADLTIDSVTYMASSGFTPTAVAASSELSVDNLDIEGVLDSNIISEADIQAGLYDYAEIEIFMVNYENTGQGSLNLRTGWLGEVRLNKNRFIVEVRGLMQNLAQNIGQLYSPSCRARLGDSRCGVNIASYTVTGSITTATGNQVFSDSARTEDDAYFTGGKITFTSGLNNGLSMEIKDFTGTTITLALPMPYTVAASDTYSMHAGCDKTFATCIAKFNNAINFRGEPHIPGLDKILETAGTI